MCEYDWEVPNSHFLKFRFFIGCKNPALFVSFKYNRFVTYAWVFFKRGDWLLWSFLSIRSSSLLGVSTTDWVPFKIHSHLNVFKISKTRNSSGKLLQLNFPKMMFLNINSPLIIIISITFSKFTFFVNFRLKVLDWYL